MPTVLVVDDSPVDRHLISQILNEGEDIEVETAGDGIQALEWMHQQRPALVVTDLQMPEMDGLELVTVMRIHCPEVPVVLITAHGSEDLAVEALEQGAASYVPKPQLAEKLLDTVQQVLARVVTDRSYERLSRCMQQADFQFSIDNDEELVARLIDLVRQIASSMELVDSTAELRVGMALEESLQNAMYRGNLELSVPQAEDAKMSRGEGARLASQRRHERPYCERSINVEISISPDEAKFVVEHDGVPLRGADKDRMGELMSSQELEHRGLVLMNAFLDEVQFDQSGKKVTMIKRRQPLPSIAAAKP